MSEQELRQQLEDAQRLIAEATKVLDDTLAKLNNSYTYRVIPIEAAGEIAAGAVAVSDEIPCSIGPDGVITVPSNPMEAAQVTTAQQDGRLCPLQPFCPHWEEVKDGQATGCRLTEDGCDRCGMRPSRIEGAGPTCAAMGPVCPCEPALATSRLQQSRDRGLKPVVRALVQMANEMLHTEFFVVDSTEFFVVDRSSPDDSKR